jgi:FixJ family two-component response regulator
MKRNVVLVLDADADTARAVASAATTRNCDLRFVQTSKEFFHFCREDFESVIAIILEIDPGMHGMAILEASDVCENTPPIVVVSALEEHCLGPVVQRHGAIACLGKPLSFTQLGRALDQAWSGPPHPAAIFGVTSPIAAVAVAERAVFKQSPQRINQPKLWNT